MCRRSGRLSSFERANEEYIAQQSEAGTMAHRACCGRRWRLMLGLAGDHRALCRRRTRGDSASHLGRQLCRLQHLHGAVDMADHRAGLGHQPVSPRQSSSMARIQSVPATRITTGNHRRFPPPPPPPPPPAFRRTTLSPTEITGDIEFPRNLQLPLRQHAACCNSWQRRVAHHGDELVLKKKT